VRLLIDTQLLIWAAEDDKRLPAQARRLITTKENELYFSVASLWEIAIKRGLKRADFAIDPRFLRRGLISNLYNELAITSEHAFTTETLPRLHKDPFDRLLIAQAIVEDITLLTSDALVASYPAPVSLAQDRAGDI
jgi:PIN domain nuclease of toxin-antitoxin system